MILRKHAFNSSVVSPGDVVGQMAPWLAQRSIERIVGRGLQQPVPTIRHRSPIHPHGESLSCHGFIERPALSVAMAAPKALIAASSRNLSCSAVTAAVQGPRVREPPPSRPRGLASPH